MVFGRKIGGESGPFDDGFLYPASLHRYPTPDMSPCGEDISSPQARVIDPAFHGSWFFAEETSPEVTIESRIIRKGDQEHRVVAVRTIPPEDPASYDREIAVVTQTLEGDVWDFALLYFGMSPDGASLTDLENMDVVWKRGDGVLFKPSNYDGNNAQN